jgi:hypothetical protein
MAVAILVDDAVMKARGWTTELLLRHDRCNVWPSDHPGQRPHDVK